MEGTIAALLLILVFVLTILMCRQESKRRKVNFFVALLICLLTSPFIGYFILLTFGLRKPKGCNWCGNQLNEAEYCGICGKNEAGLSR